VRLRLSEEAQRNIETIEAWWREHRPAAPLLFREPSASPSPRSSSWWSSPRLSAGRDDGIAQNSTNGYEECGHEQMVAQN